MRLKSKLEGLSRKFLEYSFNLFEGFGVRKIPGVFWIFSRINLLLFNEIIIDEGQKLYTGGFVGPRASWSLYYNGSHEPTVSSLFCSLLKDGMTVVDIGAYIGYYTLLAAKRVGDDGLVLSFEPDPLRFKRLVENIKINDWKNVQAFQFAVSDVEGEGTIESGESFALENAKHAITVNTICLDSFLQTDPDIVKIDVEGAEVSILRGMKRILEKGKAKIICEVHPKQMTSSRHNVTEIMDIIEMYEYKAYLIRDDGKTVSVSRISNEHAHYLFSKEE